MDKIKVGMIGGGGPKNFFGNVHRRSIALDTTRELVAGALRRSADDSIAAAKELGIRGYPDYQAMLKAQKSGEIDLDYVTKVLHFFPHIASSSNILYSGTLRRN